MNVQAEQPRLTCSHKILQIEYEIVREGNCAESLHEGGLTMAIFRVKTKEDILNELIEFGAEQTDKKKGESG